MSMPFDNYPAIAATVLAEHGAAALSMVAEELKLATIEGDADRAAFWGLVRARLRSAR